jgi:hypothetical protein
VQRTLVPGPGYLAAITWGLTAIAGRRPRRRPLTNSTALAAAALGFIRSAGR